MAVHVSHAALPYPIKNARYSFLVPGLDADGDPIDPTTPDSEISQDNGAWADAAEEVSTPSGSNGLSLMTLTGAEMNNSAVGYVMKVASGPKAPLMTIYPRALAVIGSGTLSAGSAGGGTLGTLLAYDVTGCFVRTTGGTGGGGTGGANNQARKIITYNTGTGAFTVEPNWETTPDNTTTYDVLLPEGVTLGMLRALNPATAGRTVVVDSAGLVDANTVKVGPTGSGTAQTAGDIPARLPAALVSGRMDASVGAYQSGQAPLQPTTAGRTLDVSAGGEAGVDWANVGTPGSTVNLSATTVKTLTDAPADSSGVTTLLSRLSSARAGYMDNLNVGGNVASSAEVTAIQNNTRNVFTVPEVIERPDSGTEVREVHLYLYDEIGNMEAPDSAPTLTLTNQAGTDRSSRLDSATMALVATGHYKVIYTSSSGDALEQLLWQASIVEGGVTRTRGGQTQIVDTTAVDFTSSDRTNLGAIKAVTDALPDAGALTSLAQAAALSTAQAGITAIKAVTDLLPNGGALTNLDAAVSSRATPAQVLSQVNAALDAANTEVAAVPASTASLRDMWKYLFAWRRNKKTQTATTMKLRNDGDTADIASSTVSDDGTTLTVGKDA